MNEHESHPLKCTVKRGCYRMNRHLVGTATSLVLASVLTGCGKGGSSGGNDSDGRTITFVAAK